MSWCQPCGCPGKPHEWVHCLQLWQACFGYCCSETGPDLDSAEHSMSKTPSGKVKTMTCSCHLDYSKLSIWLSEQQLHVYFFLFSRSRAHAGIQHKCILREYRLCTTHYIQWGTALIKKKNNLVTFSNRNIPTKCFLLKYWRRRTSGLNSSIQGTHSSATTTRKHWIPFCKVRRKVHTVLVNVPFPTLA